MSIPRIKWRRSAVIFDELAAHREIRYGVAVAAGLLPGTLSFLFGERFGVEFYLLMVFGAVLTASVLGGLGPGLLATLLATLIAYETPRWRITLDELRLSLIGGTLVSFGGTLRAAIIKARDREKTMLKVERQILELGEEERRRIGHDLHDGLGQHLTGISMLSETMSQQLAAGGKPNAADAERITQLVGEAIGITRDLAKSLAPITFNVDGLSAALGELAETSSSLFGIRCACEYDEDLQLDQTSALHLFRVVQEAVNNSVRHGKAKNVRIRIICENKLLKLKVIDDGVGLSMKTATRPGLGLRIMQHRAKMLGASLTVERATPDGGTVVTCVCPLDREVPQSSRKNDPAINVGSPDQEEGPAR